jgi:glycosyltransferase involved in cell wall biosynthesis
MAAGRLLGARVVLNYHSGEADDHLSRWGVLVHPWLRLAHEIVVPSEYLKEVFARHGYRANVIPNIVDTSAFTYRERGISGPRLLSTRNLEAHYGVDVVLRAYALVKRRHPRATLTVAGYGREERGLKALAHELGGEGIRFVGRQEPPQMAALYDQAEIFLNASVVDNQPVSILEAFAAGLPVISTGTGDIAHMVGHDCGRIVPSGDPAAMADAVAALVERPAVAVRMTRRARRKIAAHTWSAVRGAWAAAHHHTSTSSLPVPENAYASGPR